MTMSIGKLGGNLHHLRKGGDFGFLDRIPENRRGGCTQYTHKHCTYCAVQFVHKRGTQTTRLAQVITDCISTLCA